ncbi:MAG: DUF2845 domain-containing protein [Pseudomonadales bacterium]|nr:DUF2845 domain-containing protein [Pseudomonadales bacterium]
MRHKILALLFAGLGLAGLSEGALALRCGNRVVGQDDHQLRVANYCGNPDFVETRVIYRSGISRQPFNFSGRGLTGGNIFGSPSFAATNGDSISDRELIQNNHSTVEVPVEVWVYNFGPGRLMQEIIFIDRRVMDIQSLGYGFRQP